MSTVLEKMINSLGNAQDVLRAGKATTGRRMIGYFHPVVPEELIYAAGFQPVQLFPNFEDSITVGNSYLQTYICSYLRADLDQALKGKHAHLDGVIIPRSCEAVTFSYQTWKRHNPYAFIDYLNVPWKKSDNTVAFFTKELGRVRQNLRAFADQEFSDDALRNAIQLYNRNRELLREVYGLRKAKAPPISGFEAIHAVMSGFLFDKVEHNRLLTQLLSELSPTRAQSSAGARLLISGGRVIDRRIWDVIESAGARVVADDVNNGSRSFWHSVSEKTEDPLEALATAYANVPCAFNTSIQDRFNFISDMITSYKVNGVVFAINRNCETEAFAYPELEKRIKERFGIPTINIETDYLMSLEPFRDRVEAFLQILGA
jgi:benzoyl-CoA reductase subunit C